MDTVCMETTLSKDHCRRINPSYTILYLQEVVSLHPAPSRGILKVHGSSTSCHMRRWLQDLLYEVTNGMPFELSRG